MMSIRSFFVLAVAAGAAVFVGSSQAAGPLTVKEEQLGAWHYLYPLEYFQGGNAAHARPVFAPTTVAFGKSIATLIPGSNILAEFADGQFKDLELPKSFAPVSLSVDRKGRLYCLLGQFSYDREAAKTKWFTVWNDNSWTAPVKIPFTGCDRIAFDSQNRLWALGRSRSVAVWCKGAWDTYTYSNDKNLGFFAVRMAEDCHGDIVLFSYNENKGGYSGQLSRMVGTLVYRNGRFVRDLKGDASEWCKVEEKEQYALRNDEIFERKTGYVCRKAALNGTPHAAATVLRTDRYVLVSFGNDGLAWASVADMATQPPLLEAAEWEPVNDVTVPPTIDPKGNLWVGRENPSRLVTFLKDKTKETLGEFKASRENTIDFDQLGRAWIARWHGAFEGEVTVVDAGRLKKYASYRDALKAEAGAFNSGRILPWAVKTPKGDIGSGCGFFNEFLILGTHGERVFTPGEINPAEPEAAASASHGYNPFRDCWPWYDKDGRIYARVLGLPFCYVDGKWTPAKKDAENESAVPGAVREEEGDVAGPFQTRVRTADGRVFIFRGFHFYEQRENRLVQVDTGLNPLAYYPFWTNWFCSPGQTVPVIDPNGRLWISPLGPYAENREWFVLRHPAP